MTTETQLQRTPLHEQHLALGAKMVPFAGYEMHMGLSKGPDCARPFAKLADDAERAAMKKDGAAFSTAANALGDTCTACHSKYKAQTGG